MLPIYLDDSSMMTALEKALRSEGFEVMTPVEAGTAGAEDEGSFAMGDRARVHLVDL
jgi:hypothetical protein